MTTDVSKWSVLTNPPSVDPVEEARLRVEAEARKHFSPPGALGLPKLLDEKRCKYGIPDTAWTTQPAFDQVLVWQIAVDEGKSFGGGTILKTETTLKRELQEAPRGVIVSAGLTALDQLRSHGIDVGHTIDFYQIAPLRKRLPTIAGKEPTLVMIQARYVFGSEELASALRTRSARIITKDIDGAQEHYYCDEGGKAWKPADVQTEDG
jgi:hypothetical protein